MLIDMSRAHCKDDHLDKIVFPASIRDNLRIYPKSSIQIYNSCALWFYGQIELLICNDKYKGFSDIHHSIYKNIQYYIDTFNLISNNLQGISIIDLEKMNDPKKFYCFHSFHIFGIDKQVIYNNVLDLYLFFDSISKTGEKNINLIFQFQSILKEYREFISLVDLNNNYKKLMILDWNINLDEFNKKSLLFFESFNFCYSRIFDIISERSIRAFIDFSNQNKSIVIKELSKALIEKQLTFKNAENSFNYNEIDEYKNLLKEIKESFNYFTLYNEDSIQKFINYSQDIIYKIMNK